MEKALAARGLCGVPLLRHSGVDAVLFHQAHEFSERDHPLPERQWLHLELRPAQRHRDRRSLDVLVISNSFGTHLMFSDSLSGRGGNQPPRLIHREADQGAS